MSGVDVIELGSSDEEAQQPKPKKAKPQPNAMVHIPGKLPEVTITPTVATNSKRNLGDKHLYTKIPIAKIKDMKAHPKVMRPSGNMIANPMRNIQFIQSKKPTNYPKPKVISMPSIRSIQNPIKLHNAISNLPPSITVKRTKSQFVKIPIKRKCSGLVQPKVVQTVELDDDEPTVDPLSVGPQWYVRPEDQTTESTIEEKTNNQEPEAKKYIEITIEDSPVKPTSKKAMSEVSDLAVTIEDSPVKSTICKTPTKGKTKETPKKMKSHKTLVYPQEVLEIEIEPAIEHKNTNTDNQSEETSQSSGPVFEVMESPIKVPNTVTQSPKKAEKTPTRAVSPGVKDNNDIISIDDDTERSEFHPVYQSFINLCFKLENSDDMKKIVEKKIKAYYRQVPKSYTESEEFVDMVTSKILSITAGPDKMYLYIKDIVDELNLQRKMAQNAVKVAEDNKNNEAQTFLYGEDSQFDGKRQRQIRKLEKTIKKLHRAIQKLEEQEVDFDDEDDSVYLLTERYKERMIKVHAKFCQLTNTKMPSEPRIHIDTAPGKPTGAARRLEKWINRKVPIGAPLPFPDFHDVLRCVREANAEDKLGWNEVDIMEEARSLFVRCGRKLQRRRQENEWRLAASRLSSDKDPAENDDGLKKQLEENRKTGTSKETEVFNKFADRQNQLNLEAEEIGDKEAEESPVDSEEDDIEENVSLDNKEKRKERLKRLLQEKSTNKENNDTGLGADVEMQGNTDQLEDSQNGKRVEGDDSKPSETNNEKSTSPSACNDMDIDSDIDELHLLQKLHSEDEANRSYSESSDSASPISISDSLSDSDGNKDMSDDVISIENSSFSETEQHAKNDNLDKHDIICSSSKKQKEVEASVSGSCKLAKIGESETEVAEELCKKVQEESVNQRELSIEGVLAFSEDDNSQSSFQNCVNLNDDAISISETTIKSVNGNEETSCEIEFDNTQVVDDLGNSVLQHTDPTDSQVNEDLLLASEDEDASKGNKPDLEKSARVINNPLSDGTQDKVNIDKHNKNGFTNNSDDKLLSNALPTKASSDSISSSPSEVDVNHDKNTVVTTDSDIRVIANDNDTSTINKNGAGNQTDSTKTIEENVDLTHLETKELEKNISNDNTIDIHNSKDPPDDPLMETNKETKSNSKLKAIVVESKNIDIDKELCDNILGNECEKQQIVI